MTRSCATSPIRISDGETNVSGSDLVKTPLMKRRSTHVRGPMARSRRVTLA